MLITGGGVLYTTSTKSETVELSYTYIPRWRTLRGNVT
jgi:hypothetical protein